ncbi:MAG: hypothetical protein ACPLVJ_03400, partial [Candidatus Bathyarchaeales archaeon]
MELTAIWKENAAPMTLILFSSFMLLAWLMVAHPDLQVGNVRWDKAAKKVIGPLVKEAFQSCFPEIDVQEAVRIEGEGVIRKTKRILRARVKC